MGDSETVVAETSTVTGYAPAAYTSTGYSDPSSNATPEAPAYAGYAVPGGDAYNIDANSAGQEAHAHVGYESKQGVGTEGAAGHVSDYELGPTAEASQAAVYNSSVNGTIDSDVGKSTSAENGIVVDAEQQFVDGSVPAMSAEEERLWSIVRANSLDFNAWTALIEETEKVEDNIVKIRKVYDEFLAEFPLCYGYWKKYADHEARIGSMDKVVEVYERAVLGVTYSVDIWLHYCIFSINTYGDPDTIRRLFERGLAYVGTDYLSYPLWDKYIEYEYMREEWSRIGAIYTRILETPNQQLDRYFTSFKEFAASRPLSELRTSEEVAAVADVSSENGGHLNEGEHPDAAEPSSKPLLEGLTSMCGPSMLRSLKIGITIWIL